MIKIFLVLLLSFNLQAMSKNKNVTACSEKAQGPCLEFAGRARLYNNRDVRIWRKGTNRMYEITTQTQNSFYQLKHISSATEIHATFDVCLMKPEEKSGLAHVCVQSVKDLKTSNMPE